jgi:hypothetical protein
MASLTVPPGRRKRKKGIEYSEFTLRRIRKEIKQQQRQRRRYSKDKTIGATTFCGEPMDLKKS